MTDTLNDEAVGIGTRLWFYDENLRVYAKGTGATSGPIYAEHFDEVEVVGETKGTWIVGTPGTAWERDTVNKKTLLGRKNAFRQRAYLTVAQRDAKVWLNDHRRRISDSVLACDDVAVLEQVAALVGYDPAPRTPGR